jgi:hypothetical protein
LSISSTCNNNDDDDDNNNKLSFKWVKISNGVPQGSVLGLLPFRTYINDLPNNVEQIGFPIFFADDASILVPQSNLAEFNKKLIIAFKTFHD